MSEKAQTLEELERMIGYHFQDRKYLKLAMTHSSYANENKKGRTGKVGSCVKQ